MEEDKTVGDYGLGSGSRIHVKLRPIETTEEDTAEPSKPTQQQENPFFVEEMDWEQEEMIVELIVRAGAVKTTYNVPLKANSWQLIQRYASDIKNEIYADGNYALYKDTYQLPYEALFLDLVDQKIISQGDRLVIAP